MNKEIIKKYRKEFDHWLDGGKLLCKSIFYNDLGWIEPNYTDFWFYAEGEGMLLIIDDKYVEFRKALAEGKTIQHNPITQYHNIWSNITSINPSTHDTVKNYRIKPDEPKFKVGDWVCTIGGSIYQISSVNLVHGTEHFTAWKPQEGEWCWFRSDNMPKYIQVLAQFKEYCNGKYAVVFNPKDVEEGTEAIYYTECEPFIGELPSFIKDK